MLSTDNTVGNTIAKLRIEKGISQEVLSGLADIGRSHLSMIERGLRNPTLDTIFKICTALNTLPSELFKEIEQSYHPSKQEE